MDKMREKLKKTARAVTGKNSLFTRIFSGLILLSLGMVLFLGFWMNHVSSQNYRRQVAQSNLSRLKQADEAMGLITSVMSQSMAQVMWSNDFITFMVSPGHTTQEQDYRIIRQLRSGAGESELVKTAFLYSPLAEKVYDGSSISGAKEYENWPVIEDYLKDYIKADEPLERRSDTMITTTVWPFEGRMFIIQDLNIASRIGILVYELDTKVLGDTLGIGGTAADSEVFIYDREHRPLFGDMLPYESIAPAWEEADRFLKLEQVDGQAGSRVKGFYRYDSPRNGWTYLMPLNTKGLLVNAKDILPMYLLAAAAFLAVSIIFDFYVSNSIYRPINRLLKLVTETDGRLKPSGDAEVDFLEDVYSDAIGQQSQLKGLIVNIAPEILDSMLENLMVGKTLEEQRVAEILEGVGNPIGVHGRFLVLVCQMSEPKGREVTDAELNLHLLSIRKLVEGTEIPGCRIYDIRTEKMIVAIVMGFPSDYPVVGIKKECAKISRLLEQLGEKIPYRLQLEKGSIYQNIMDLRYAYREALERLYYQQYLESSEAKEGEEQDSDADLIVSRRYLKERTRTLAEQAGQGNREESEILLHQIVADFKQAGLKPEEFKSAAEQFFDELTERVIMLPLSEEDQHLLEATRAAAELRAGMSTEEMNACVLEYSRMTLGLLHVYNKKNSYRYVKQAKEYIEQNYADSNLSLNDVCEHIGISASYLSELFNEINGEKFSACLASFRVEKASQLLRTTNVTIKEIGFCCGFNSVQNFIRVFKKYMDQTPGHYRETQE